MILLVKLQPMMNWYKNYVLVCTIGTVNESTDDTLLYTKVHK